MHSEYLQVSEYTAKKSACKALKFDRRHYVATIDLKSLPFALYICRLHVYLTVETYLLQLVLNYATHATLQFWHVILHWCAVRTQTDANAQLIKCRLETSVVRRIVYSNPYLDIHQILLSYLIFIDFFSFHAYINLF